MAESAFRAHKLWILIKILNVLIEAHFLPLIKLVTLFLNHYTGTRTFHTDGKEYNTWNTKMEALAEK